MHFGAGGLRLRLLRRYLLAVLGLLVLAWAALLARHVVEVRHELLSAKSAAAALHRDLGRADVTGSEVQVAALKRHADAAARASRGHLWSLSAHVPLLGGQLTSVHALSLAISQLSDRALAPASAALDNLQQHPPVVNGVVDVAALTSLRGVLENTMNELSATQTQVAAARGAHLLPQLRSAEDGLVKQIAELRGQLVPLDRSLTLAPDMLGFDGKRTYLLAVQNPAEARGTGGLVAAYSLVSADHGRLTVVRSGTNLDFNNPLSPAAIYRGLETGGAATTKATGTFFAANALPDWARAGKTLAALSSAQFHTTVDGVIGVTPAAMGRILTVTGPVVTAGGEKITGKNAAYFVQVGEYRDIASTAARKAAIGDLAQVMVSKLVHGRLGLGQLQHAFAGSLGTGDLTLYSTHAAEQAQIAQTSLAGTLPSAPSFIQVVSDNTGGGKMDAYLHRQVTVTRLIGTSEIDVTASFTNTAPTGLSSYQTSRLDDGGRSAPVGSARDLVSLYAGVGASVASVTVDGAAVSPLRETDLGHPRVSVDLRVNRGQKVTVRWVVRNAPGIIDYRVQPLAVAEKSIIHN